MSGENDAHRSGENGVPTTQENGMQPAANARVPGEPGLQNSNSYNALARGSLEFGEPWTGFQTSCHDLTGDAGVFGPNVLCKLVDIPVKVKSNFQQYDNTVLLHGPNDAFVPSGSKLSENEYVVCGQQGILKYTTSN